MEQKIYYRGKLYHGAKRDVHRIAMEEHLGRSLTRREVVHHINGDIHDNRLENLQLMTLSEHSRMHRTGHPLTEEAKQKLSQVSTGKIRSCMWVMTKEQAESARQRHDQGESWRSIGKEYGISHETVRDSVNRTGGRP